MKHGLTQGLIAVLAFVSLEPALVLAQTAPAKVGYVEGKVFIKRGQDGTVEQAEVGTGVFRGDTILTKPGGRAQVNLAASGVLRLSANTTISFPKEDKDFDAGGLISMKEGQTWSNIKQLAHDKIFEVRTPTLVAGTSDAIRPGGALSDYVVGMPLSDQELHQSMSKYGITSSWPSIASDASKPIIPLNCKLAVTIWGPFHHKYKYVLSLIHLDGVVSGTGRRLKPLPPDPERTKEVERYAFTGTLIDNQITGEVVYSLELEHVRDGVTYDYAFTGGYNQRLTLNIDGSVTGVAEAGTWNSRGTTTSSPAGSPPKPFADSGKSEGGQLTGRWEFGPAKAVKSGASQ